MSSLRSYIDERILEAARELFNRSGFAETDMKAIAKEAGIAVGTIYNYYESKQALFEKVIVDNWENAYEELQRISQNTKEPEEKIRLLIEAVYECVDREKNFFNEPCGADMPRPVRFKAMMEQIRKVKVILEDSLGQGRDAARIAEAIVSVIPKLVRFHGHEREKNLEFLYRLADRM